MAHPTPVQARAEPARAPAAPERRLLEVVRALASELHGGDPPAHCSLASSLERDLGFDSLGRVELLHRVEHAFGVRLSEQALVSAETPRELLALVSTAQGRGRAEPPPAPATERALPAADDDEDRPLEAATLVEVLEWHAAHHPERVHLLLEDGARSEALTYGELLAEGLAVAAGLRARGLERGDSVALMLPTSRDYFRTFAGILLAGCVPVPIYPPARPSQLEDHLRRHARILANAEARALVTVPEALRVARWLGASVAGLRQLVTPDELARGDALAEPVHADPHDLALLQYTSGSTGQPKGVMLTHADLLANLHAMGSAIGAGPRDVFVSWLPLYHDMGLIGAWLGSLYIGFRLVAMSPLVFLARPARWLQAIGRHRATLSAGPNFAYELCLAKVADEELEGVDLSSWRLAFNGAEPVGPDTVRRFGARFARFGFRPEAMAPVYGLAECGLGLAFPPVGRGPLIDRVEREALARDGAARPCAADAPGALRFVACGSALPGYELCVVDEAGHELPERREGRVLFRGPSATQGYFRNPQATRALRRGDWLDTGDLGYLVGGELYLTSRAKDVIIRAGRNVYPAELEAAVGELEGVRKGCVVAFGAADARAGTERLVVVAETRASDPDERARLRRAVERASLDLLGAPPDEVCLAPPRSVLKTSSGKVRRSACKELYERGELGRSRAVWLQVARVLWSGSLARARRAARALVEGLYAAWAWCAFALVAPPAWLAVMLLPTQRARRLAVRAAARALRLATATPLEVRGLEHLERGPCICVGNHASYLDAFALAAVLPERFAFVAKRELAEHLLTRLPLARLGTELVERADARRGVADARRLAEQARAGRSFVCFPEGGLERRPGLRAFHLGAFAAAVEADLPVVPVAIRGTRAMLSPGQWFPRRGAIELEVGQPLSPARSRGDGPRDDGWSAAVALRDAARAALATGCGEPDRLASVRA